MEDDYLSAPRKRGRPKKNVIVPPNQSMVPIGTNLNKPKKNEIITKLDADKLENVGIIKPDFSSFVAASSIPTKSSTFSPFASAIASITYPLTTKSTNPIISQSNEIISSSSPSVLSIKSKWLTIPEHRPIYNRLTEFMTRSSIPNLLFYGEAGSGKKSIVAWFVNHLYYGTSPQGKDSQKMLYGIDSAKVLISDCITNNGIDFVRNNIQYFAKTNTIYNSSEIAKFKVVIMYNAEHLTSNAQTALRRCIEIYSTSTRFIMIVRNPERLIAPILSRFCDIYVPLPLLNDVPTSLYKYNKNNKAIVNPSISNNTSISIEPIQIKKQLLTQQILDYQKAVQTAFSISSLQMAEKLYEQGYSGIDILEQLDNFISNPIIAINLRLKYDIIRKHFYNECAHIAFLLHYISMRNEIESENLSNK